MSLFGVFLVGAGIFIGLYFIGDENGRQYNAAMDSVPPNSAPSGAAYVPYTPAAAVPAPVTRY